MQLLLPLPAHADDTALARSPDRGLLLGFGRLPEHKIPLAVDALWTVLTQAGAAATLGSYRPAGR